MADILTRYEQSKQAFLHARSYATALDFMAVAVRARGLPEGKDEMESFYDQLLSWVIDKLIEADHERSAAA
jgi:hypothetical protein